jgi:ketosteroid isomerase-like protein
MSSRNEVEALLREVYAARLRHDVDGICKNFAENACFRLAGSSEASAIPTKTETMAEFRTLMTSLVKTFVVSNLNILAIVIEGAHAAVHWQVTVRSGVNGQSSVTELFDLVEIKDGRIVSFTEFCDTALVGQLMMTP